MRVAENKRLTISHTKRIVFSPSLNNETASVTNIPAPYVALNVYVTPPPLVEGGEEVGGG